MPAGNASAPPVATDPVVPFSAEDAASLELPTASAAVGRADGPAEEVSVASEVGRHSEAAARAAAWKADVSQDFAWRQAMVMKMQQGEQVYCEEEAALIAKGLALLDGVALGTGKLLKRSKTGTSAWTRLDKKSGLLTGLVEATIRASPRQIVAYQMHYDSKVKMSQLDPALEVRYECLEVKNLHHIVMYYEMKTTPYQNRTFLNSLLWQKLSDAPLTYIWVSVPIELHDKVPPEQEKHAVRADGLRFLRCTRIADGQTKIQFACSVDLKGHFPRRLTNSLVIPNLLRVPYDLETYFLQCVPIDLATADDGACIGNLLADVAEASKKSNRASAIRAFVLRSAVLRECGFATLDAMLIGPGRAPSPCNHSTCVRRTCRRRTSQR